MQEVALTNDSRSIDISADIQQLVHSNGIYFKHIQDGKEYGYFGSGTTNKMWRYDPVSGILEELSGAPILQTLTRRTDVVKIQMNGKYYVGFGRDGNTLFDDLYEFDPNTNGGTWSGNLLVNGSLPARFGAYAFTLVEGGQEVLFIGGGTGFESLDFKKQTSTTKHGGDDYNLYRLFFC